MDQEALHASAVVTTAGPGVHVTRTDRQSVGNAAVYRLNEENFTAFLTAAESLAALEQRDPAVRDYLDVNVSDAGSPDADNGRHWFEGSTDVRSAIAASGLTVAEYYVASIAIGSADRFLRAPRSAPRTPALIKNATFLRAHAADLARLRMLREARADVLR